MPRSRGLSFALRGMGVVSAARRPMPSRGPPPFPPCTNTDWHSFPGVLRTPLFFPHISRNPASVPPPSIASGVSGLASFFPCTDRDEVPPMGCFFFFFCPRRPRTQPPGRAVLRGFFSPFLGDVVLGGPEDEIIEIALPPLFPAVGNVVDVPR